MSPFEQAFQIVIGEEGGLSLNPADPGNWTGGAQNRGLCRGTKFGISASAHPHLDIAAITLPEAQAIYRQDYWSITQTDELPPPLALLVFDAAVNCGPQHAVHWLQVATGTAVETALTQATLAAIRQSAAAPAALCAEFQAQRMLWMTTLPTWHVFGLGWSRRLCRLPYDSVKMGQI
jgi:lysozyme family protein